MVEIVREFVVREEDRGQFELAYGPGGAWSRLFARRPGFRGTTVLRDTKDPRRYVTIDVWETEAQLEQALADGEAEYASLQAALTEWTETRTELGVFRMLAEAAVRPQGRTAASKARGARRSSGRSSTRGSGRTSRAGG